MQNVAKLLALILGLFGSYALADDGAASIAAGGLIVMTRETGITMAKERLEISTTKVTVDYDFRNDSDQDITTTVAFPIPDYSFGMDETPLALHGFDDFRLWIDERPSQFQVEARAYIKNQDYTDLLNRLRVDVGSFGHASDSFIFPDIRRLSLPDHRLIEREGLLDKKFGYPNWTVRKKYYWKQRFPAHGVVHIRHEYTPSLGSTNSVRYGMGPAPDPAMKKELTSLCISPSLSHALEKVIDSKDKDASDSYVDFILTTANTWKTPIEDFTLIVDRPHFKGSLADYVSLCWDGPIVQIDAGHFSAHANNFVPKEELRVGFIDVYPTR